MKPFTRIARNTALQAMDQALKGTLAVGVVALFGTAAYLKADHQKSAVFKQRPAAVAVADFNTNFEPSGSMFRSEKLDVGTKTQRRAISP